VPVHHTRLARSSIPQLEQTVEGPLAHQLPIPWCGILPTQVEVLFPELPDFHILEGLGRHFQGMPPGGNARHPVWRASNLAREWVVPFSRHISTLAGTIPARTMRSPSLIMIAQKRIKPKISQ